VTRNDGLIDTRFSARSARMRLTATADAPFAVGRPRLNIVLGGQR